MNVARSNQRQQSKSFPNDLFLITGIKDEPGAWAEIYFGAS